MQLIVGKFFANDTFGAAFGYETASVLAAALVKTGGNAKGLRHALINVHDLAGSVISGSVLF